MEPFVPLNIDHVLIDLQLNPAFWIPLTNLHFIVCLILHSHLDAFACGAAIYSFYVFSMILDE